VKNKNREYKEYPHPINIKPSFLLFHHSIVFVINFFLAKEYNSWPAKEFAYKQAVFVYRHIHGTHKSYLNISCLY